MFKLDMFVRDERLRIKSNLRSDSVCCGSNWTCVTTSKWTRGYHQFNNILKNLNIIFFIFVRKYMWKWMMNNFILSTENITFHSYSNKRLCQNSCPVATTIDTVRIKALQNVSCIFDIAQLRFIFCHKFTMIHIQITKLDILRNI